MDGSYFFWGPHTPSFLEHIHAWKVLFSLGVVICLFVFRVCPGLFHDSQISIYNLRSCGEHSRYGLEISKGERRGGGGQVRRRGKIPSSLFVGPWPAATVRNPYSQAGGDRRENHSFTTRSKKGNTPYMRMDENVWI